MTPPTSAAYSFLVSAAATCTFCPLPGQFSESPTLEMTIVGQTASGHLMLL